MFELSPCLICIEHERWQRQTFGCARAGTKAKRQTHEGAPEPGVRHARGGDAGRGVFFVVVGCVLIVPFGESPHVVAKGNVWDNKHTLLHWTRFQGWSSPGNDIFDDHAPNSLVDAQRPGGGYRPNATLTEHVPIPQEWAR